ncbi:hypothetical protein RHGRI_002151 [Rhododendron griersonianum]|uniref:Uncharacterized protein n=1 Tax=Rhododendron griersonianum TaxID=479676 RepID=A0AAV6LP47_9ERIC|nr:hypothetical protein RHGRI_002151 [Rhododendron griersonianum]
MRVCLNLFMDLGLGLFISGNLVLVGIVLIDICSFIPSWTSFFSVLAVAPICYAHLAATQVGTLAKFEEFSETSSSHGGLTSAGPAPVPQLPKLQATVCNSVFFC